MKDFLLIKDEGHRIKDKIESTLKLTDEGNKSFILHSLSIILEKPAAKVQKKTYISKYLC